MNKLIIFLFVALTFPNFGFSQNESNNPIDYDVHKSLPYLSITKEKLKEVKTLLDLNPKHKSSWIKEYISVEISISYTRKLRRATNKSDVLSPRQKEIINMADVDTDILVNIKYLPNNSFSHNEIKELDFVVTIVPEQDAQYIGGQAQLKKYLKTSIVDKIPAGSFKQYEVAAIQFTINEAGEITNAHVFDSVYNSYKNKEVYDLLLKSVRNMPCWKPAEYTDGTKAKQELVLVVGDMKSCIVNVLNIRNLPPE